MVIIEEQDNFFLVGGSSYQISEVLTKTFPEAEIKSEINTPRRHCKLLFNICLYGEHTVMSENIFATLKWRQPFLTNMRHHIKLAQKVIKVACVWENICHEQKEDLPEDDEDNDDNNRDKRDNSENNDRVYDRENQLLRGKAKRLELMDQMVL